MHAPRKAFPLPTIFEISIFQSVFKMKLRIVVFVSGIEVASHDPRIDRFDMQILAYESKLNRSKTRSVVEALEVSIADTDDGGLCHWGIFTLDINEERIPAIIAL